MIWSLRLAGKRILYNKKQYLFIVLQVLLGVALLYSSICVDMSSARQSAMYADTIANQMITISGSSGDGEGLSILPEDFTYIQEKLQPEGSRVAYAVESAVYVMQNDQEYRIQVQFVSDAFFDIILNSQELDHPGYCLGSKVSNIFQGDPIEVIYGEYAYQNQTGELFGVPLSDYRVLNARQSGQTARSYYAATQSNDDYSFANTIFVPMAGFAQYRSFVQGTAYIYIAINHDNAVTIQEFVNQTVQYLNQEHPNAVYQYADDYQDLQLLSTRTDRNAALIRMVAILLLVIVTFGLLGLFLLLAKRRQRSFAVAIMCGATNKQIIIELFIEISVLLCIGTCLGMIIGGFLLTFFNTPLYPVHNSVSAILICLGLTACISAVVTFIVARSAVKFAPVDVLRQQ